jgi:hypothetical protein
MTGLPWCRNEPAALLGASGKRAIPERIKLASWPVSGVVHVSVHGGGRAAELVADLPHRQAGLAQRSGTFDQCGVL